MRSPTSSESATVGVGVDVEGGADVPETPDHLGVAAAPLSPASTGVAWLAHTWRTDRWRVVRWAALTAYATLVLVQYRWGLPAAGGPGIPLRDREVLIVWMLAGCVVWSLGRDRREILVAVAGWGALAVCFVLYDYTRGAIDGWWGDPVRVPGTNSTVVPAQSLHNAERVLTAERALFFGVIPTEWLQDHFYRRGGDGPRWEAITALTYLSHFVVVYLVALIAWFRDRARWLEWVRALVTLIVLGLLGYGLYPTAPPWLADRFSLMGSVARPGTRGLGHVNLEIADRLWNKGRDTFNIVAAMPSLHFGFTALVLFFFWRTARPWMRVILLAYPTVMLFTLAYGGEHYVLDCVVGGLLAWFAVWINRRIDAWRAARSRVTSVQNLSECDTGVSLPLRTCTEVTGVTEVTEASVTEASMTEASVTDAAGAGAGHSLV